MERVLVATMVSDIVVIFSEATERRSEAMMLVSEAVPHA